MLRVDLGHCVNTGDWNFSASAGGQRGAVEAHTFFKLSRKNAAWLKKDQAFVIVSKRVLWLKVQVNFVACSMPLQ